MSGSMSRVAAMLVDMERVTWYPDDVKSDTKREIIEYNEYWFYPLCAFSIITVLCKVFTLETRKQDNLFEKKKQSSLQMKLSIVSFFFATAVKLYKLKHESKLHELVFRRWISIQYLDGHLCRILMFITEEQNDLNSEDPLKKLALLTSLKISTSCLNIANLTRPMNYVEALFAPRAREASLHLKHPLQTAKHEIYTSNANPCSTNSFPLQLCVSDEINVLVVFNPFEPDEQKICRRLTTLLKIRYPNLKVSLSTDWAHQFLDLAQELNEDIDRANINLRDYDIIFSRDVCLDARATDIASNFVYFHDDQSRMRNTFELMGLTHFKLNINTLKKRLLLSSDFVLVRTNY
jgi:hypothetical protein